jgi:proteasome assembly chaperone (PAC2) family protein
VLLVAFEGWNDAGDAATTAARWMRDRWNGQLVADIDSEDFYDFTSLRPQVHLADGVTREIVWPANEIFATTVPATDIDALVLVGNEPHLRWRTFCRQVIDVAEALDVRMVITLGALLAEVAHSRPVSVVGTAAETDLIERLGLRRSTYEGPTGIVGVLHDACRQAGLPSLSLWSAVPAYAPGAPSPKAALALVERVAEIMQTQLVTTDLEIASAAYERQLDELVTSDDDMTTYVQSLEERYDDGIDVELPTGDELVQEVERYLRDQDD